MLEKSIKIIRPTGEEEYKIITSFSNNDQSYIVVDSKLKDANQNIIVYVSRINGDTLEDIIDDNEWSNVKSILISIVKNMDNNMPVYITDLKNTYNSSQNIGHTLALPDKFLVKIVEAYNSLLNKEQMAQEIKSDLETPIVEENVPIEETASNTNNLEESINRVDINEPVDIVENNSLENMEQNNPTIPIIEETIKKENSEEINEPSVQNVLENNSIENITPIEETANVQVPVEEPVISDIQSNVESIEPVSVAPQVDIPQPIIEDNNVENVTPVEENINVQVPVEEPVVSDVEPVVENVGPVTVTPQVDIPQPIIEDNNMENVTPVQEPIVQNIQQLNNEPVINEFNQNVNQVTSNIEITEDIESIKSSIIALCEKLQAKEKELAEKEQMINAKLEIANIAFNNAQAVNNTLNSQMNVQNNEQAQSRVLAA